MTFEKDELLKQARDVDMKIVLSFYGAYLNQHNKVCCIFHDEDTPSASVRLNRYKCFGCGVKASNIDIVMHKEGIVNNRDAAKKVLEIANQNIEVKTIQTQDKNGYNKKDKKTLTFDDRVRLTDFTNIDKIKDYLKSRAIDPAVLEVLDRNGIKYGVDKLGQINFFFLKGKFCIYRSLTDKNFNCGVPAPVCIKTSNSKEWYIVEGLFDALTLVDINKNVICLNSTSQTDKFLNSINIDNKNFKYIIATDNDEGGFNALEKMSIFFNENDIDYDVFDELIGSGCKDVNEMRLKGLL